MSRFLLFSSALALLTAPVFAQDNDYATDYVDAPETVEMEPAAPAGQAPALPPPSPTESNAQPQTSNETLIIPPAMESDPSEKDMSAQEMEAEQIQQAQPETIETFTDPAAPTQIAPPPAPRNNVVRIRPEGREAPQDNITVRASDTMDANAGVQEDIIGEGISETPETVQMNEPAAAAAAVKVEQPVTPDKPTAPQVIPPAADMPDNVPPPQTQTQVVNTAPEPAPASNGVCSSGKMQSPVNIAAYRPDENLKPLTLNYTTGPLSVTNTGQTIEAEFGGNSTFQADGKTYALKHVHFHTPSGHYFKGVPYAMEGHMLHQSQDGEWAVVGVMIKVGKNNPAIQSIWSNIPMAQGEKKTVVGQFNPADLLPGNQSYYTYEGSLIMPPCTENVTWYVMQTPIEISEDQLRAFQTLYPHNSRVIQPLNKRIVSGTKQ